jgi:hypothetical protein
MQLETAGTTFSSLLLILSRLLGVPRATGGGLTDADSTADGWVPPAASDKTTIAAGPGKRDVSRFKADAGGGVLSWHDVSGGGNGGCGGGGGGGGGRGAGGGDGEGGGSGGGSSDAAAAFASFLSTPPAGTSSEGGGCGGGGGGGSAGELPSPTAPFVWHLTGGDGGSGGGAGALGTLGTFGGGAGGAIGGCAGGDCGGDPACGGHHVAPSNSAIAGGRTGAGTTRISTATKLANSPLKRRRVDQDGFAGS